MTEFLAIIHSFDWSLFLTIVQAMQSLGVLWPIVKVVLQVAGFLWVFWVLYVATMAVYRLHLSGELKTATTSRVTRALCYSLVAIAVIVDAIAQYTVASAIFLEAPKTREYLVTDRLQRYMALATPTWRTVLADWICLHILDLFDPKKNHCKRRSAA